MSERVCSKRSEHPACTQIQAVLMPAGCLGLRKTTRMASQQCVSCTANRSRSLQGMLDAARACQPQPCTVHDRTQSCMLPQDGPKNSHDMTSRGPSLQTPHAICMILQESSRHTLKLSHVFRAGRSSLTLCSRWLAIAILLGSLEQVFFRIKMAQLENLRGWCRRRRGLWSRLLLRSCRRLGNFLRLTLTGLSGLSRFQGSGF